MSNKYKITDEIADAYSDLMQADIGNVAFNNDPFDARREIVEKAIATLRSECNHLGCARTIASRDEVRDMLGVVVAAWHAIPSGNKVMGSIHSLREALVSLKPEPSPKKGLNERLDAIRELLDGDKGVIFAVTPQGVTRWGLSADCRINRNAHHIGAVIIALATSLGFIEEEGDDD